MHKVDHVDKAQPKAGATIRIGALEAKITAMGDYAWKKVIEIGHVVINFNSASAAERPGEICATVLDGAQLMANLKPGQSISIS
jgi:PTS system glucitol/sorbitol-specific IIA component